MPPATTTSRGRPESSFLRFLALGNSVKARTPDQRPDLPPRAICPEFVRHSASILNSRMGYIYRMGVDFAAAIRDRLERTRQSKHRAALKGGLQQDAIRSVLNGHSPRLDRAERICAALGLELYIGPPRKMQLQTTDESGLPSRFSSDVELPVRSSAHCAPEGYMTQVDDSDRAPAPLDVNLSDPRAFYACYTSNSMIPAGIWPGDYCLVSPYARLEAGRRVWLRSRQGREAIGWLVRLTANTLELGGWRPPDERGRQQLVPVPWEYEEIADRGLVAAVYRGRPAVERPPFRVPDWGPDKIAGLWRALFDSEETGEDVEVKLAEHLEKKAADFDRTIRAWLEQGTVSFFEMWRLLQEVEAVKQSAQLLSRRLGSSDNNPGERDVGATRSDAG